MLALLVAYNFSANKMVILETESGRVIQLIGNVHVQGRRADITSRFGMYYEASKLSVLHGNAIVHGPDYTISSDTLRYIPNPEYLYLSGGAFIEDKYRTISSRNIEVIEDSSIARGDVQIYLKQKDILILGDTGYYNLTDKSGKLVGNPRAQINRKDTVVITADTFYMLRDTLWATGRVVVSSGRATAWGDTLSAFESDTAPRKTAGPFSVANPDTTRLPPRDSTGKRPRLEQTVLTGICRVEWEGGWATSDTVVMTSVDGTVAEMDFISHAVVQRTEGSSFLAIEGNRVKALFKEGEVSEVYADNLTSGLYQERKKEE